MAKARAAAAHPGIDESGGTSRPEADQFPVADVNDCARDAELQAAQPFSRLSTADQDAMEARRLAAIEDGASETTRWIYFRSPPWTWEHLCGRAGWLLFDEENGRQLEFRLEVMN